MSFFVCMGMAEAVVCKGGVGGEVERPAGDAIELGNIKSSMFMASGSKGFDTSIDCRSFAIPEGLLVLCWLALVERFVSVKAYRKKLRS